MTLTGVALTFLIYDSFSDLNADMNVAVRALRLDLFNRGYIEKITEEDVRYIYQKRCYRQCHGEAAMITAVLSPAGWFQVVERMRVKENVTISGREADEIIKYLEQSYPTVKSAYEFETRKRVHHAVWRNDMGEGDIYTDVTYVTPEYLASIGAKQLEDGYNLVDHHVFIMGFSVHEGEVELIELDEKTTIRSSKGEFSTTPPWKLRFQTADKHHFEAIVRFAKKGDKPVLDGSSKWFELLVKNVGGSKLRVFRWELPIDYPPEIYGNGG